MRDNGVTRRWSLALSWARMLAGKSYSHLDQSLSKRFVPGELSGYYNDLSQKVRWNGPVDAEGLPLMYTRSGEPFYHPTDLFQKALGHWDLWLSGERQEAGHYEAFLRLASWAQHAQDECGGWRTLPAFQKHYDSPYSCMTQGEGISLLVRAFSVTADNSYLKSARQALGPLLTPVDEEGTLRRVPAGLVLEEYPLRTGNTVLNGWIFGLYGLYDYLLVEESQEIQEALEANLNALIAHLPQYDTGFWSLYDAWGALASPFYHRLHIAQLRALELAFPEHAKSFAKSRATFERQLASRSNRMRAMFLKACQKLRHPPEVVML
jgi:heparosan-N-sulfate-glucuronate 5-epimerase